MRKVLLFILAILVLAETHVFAVTEEIFIYESRGKRDPFVPLVGVTAQAAGSLEDVMSIDDVKLQGFASDSTGKKAAILNGEMVREEETVGRVTVKSISRNKVIIMLDEDAYELDIYGEVQ